MIDVSQQRTSFLKDAATLQHLPPALLERIKDPTTTNFLDAVSSAALIPAITERVFVHFENVFPDICARWILSSEAGGSRINVVSAFSRILAFDPNLSDFLKVSIVGDYNGTRNTSSLIYNVPQLNDASQADANSSQYLLDSLVAIWRLLNLDQQKFTPIISLPYTQSLFRHESRAVRYVAIRIFCLLLRFSDVKLETLVSEYVGSDDPIQADLDGRSIDFRFLSFHERSRVKTVLSLRRRIIDNQSTDAPHPFPQALTPCVLCYGKVVLPRPHLPNERSTALKETATTLQNLESFALMLKSTDPILLHGLPGVGKTLLVHEIARQFRMDSSMVTLHINEQTDAKMLIGLYSTNSKPGSFQWRPGVLSAAVREGRWVLIEDLDRAPTEVLSSLLPLIERRELLVPSRGETIRAASSFRLFATIRSSQGVHGRETLPSTLGMRFWQSLHVKPINEEELTAVVVQTYPILRKYTPEILAVYRRLSQICSRSKLLSRGRGIMSRQVSLRDLMKWCRRLKHCLLAHGCTSGDEPIEESAREIMFMEALDCFVASCPDVEIFEDLLKAIAEEMHMPRDKKLHLFNVKIPDLEESEQSFRIGRTTLPKMRVSPTLRKSKLTFAHTAHAKRLEEQIAVAVKLKEPVLLVGETGIGKTTVVQQLAESLGQKLMAVNLSQQSGVGDLLGGFKPVSVRSLAFPLKEEFEDLFAATGISAIKNQKYLEQIGKCFAKEQWSRVTKLLKEAPLIFERIISELERRQTESRDESAQPFKRRKTQPKLQSLLALRPRWEMFARNLDQFQKQITSGSSTMAFTFVEGNLVKAVRNGYWILLDEINLASPDTLESIADLLTGSDESPYLLLAESGEIEKIVAHSSFRIFGAMNPATDIGKRDLSISIRSRFTELYVKSPGSDLRDLLSIIKTCLDSKSIKHEQAADDVAHLYLNTKRMAEERRIVDGASEVPHFSLRTLTRVLNYARTIAPYYGLRRALYEGFSMGFLTLLDRKSEEMLLPLIHHHLLDEQGDSRPILSTTPKLPNDGRHYVRFRSRDGERQYWLPKGDQTPVERDDYVITPSVERNLLNLVRATTTGRFPVLIQGPTSAGKTSMIEYLANFTGNRFVRINNHEHTDLQEYLGTYISGSDGSLRFQDGVLVQAMRKGHWIVLDELNLAPTDVLEALNRLLDDNRELLVPETQEVIRPHRNFILFATQNPPGLYGGRKILSRAFRNRFLELHFDDIPEDELEYIVQQRSRYTSPPDCRRIVSVYKELSRLRQTSRLFEQKESFATLRDLFRWALRDAESREDIAANGYMLLAERVRNEEERLAVQQVIDQIFKVKIDPKRLYSIDNAPELNNFSRQRNQQGVVWTYSMRRLYVLVVRALRNNEPVLLVGETGCGKTTVCQLLAEALGKELHIVNAHQNTETGDIIGSQRPVRNRGAIVEALSADLTSIFSALNLTVPDSLESKLEMFHSIHEYALPEDLLPAYRRAKSNESRSNALFEWSDGALVHAMKQGHLFLLDEISLADDSVLERLNSVLEPQRSLLLAEKGIDDPLILASDEFQFLATMNPGGDFGKKELSPSLRNRFTEIWVPSLSEEDDISQIVRTKLGEHREALVDVLVNFAAWFGKTFRPMAATRFSIRELLVWVEFIKTFECSDPIISLVHGASAVFIDSLGANPSAQLLTDLTSLHQQRRKCLQKLSQLLGRDVEALGDSRLEVHLTEDSFAIGDFCVTRLSSQATEPGFAFHAPTTKLNTMRIVRALQMQKPILLEGSPGVGKTSLVSALAQTCGRPLTRINLSDQTDLMDLFGTDVPVEGAEAGHFTWRDAPFLQAMQKGEWVLLDEMNLASQSVLEGLNACLDHRGEVYISELDQTFKRHPEFRLFAAQNPHLQGGGRKGLPASFVNRFIVVYADALEEEDMNIIISHNFPNASDKIVCPLIKFVSEMNHQLLIDRSFGLQDSPWEFNLRDILRWLALTTSADPLLQAAEFDDFLDIIVRQRFRTSKDREHVSQIFKRVIGWEPRTHHLYHDANERFCQVGLALLERNTSVQAETLPPINVIPRLSELESLMISTKQNFPCILSGPSGCGKSALLQYAAAQAGKPLVVFPLNADVDTMDLIGGFEQVDPLRELNVSLRQLRDRLQASIAILAPAEAPTEALHLLQLLDLHSDQIDHLYLIREAAESLQSKMDLNSELGFSIERSIQLLKGPLIIDNPRFEWLDGIIVDALQTGKWLVLDNANMCNSSVLDRLNSLLEPNGYLSINEHCDSNGLPRKVVPHPDFRIFLTVDPKYGELSRAMRNRSVEIYIQTAPPTPCPYFRRITTVESKLRKFVESSEICEELSSEPVSSNASFVTLENLAMQNLTLLPQFVKESLSYDAGKKVFAEPAHAFLQFLRSAFGVDYLKLIQKFYSQLQTSSGLSIANFQPLHVLNNYNVARLLPESAELIWTGARIDTCRLLYGLQKSIEGCRDGAHSTKLASLTRLQRSLIRNRAPTVAKDSAVNLAAFLSDVTGAIKRFITFDETVQDPEAVSYFLLSLVIYLSRLVALASEILFDDAKFSAQLLLGAGLMNTHTALIPAGASDAACFVKHQLSTQFRHEYRLTTGLCMESLWKSWRPIPFPSKTVFDHSMELERLAAKFDTLRWQAKASISDLIKAQKTLAEAYRVVRVENQLAEELVSDLTTALGSLESGLDGPARPTKPLFAYEAESLRQLSMLTTQSSDELSILSDLPTGADLALTISPESAAKLQFVDNLTFKKHYCWDGKLLASLWHNIEGLSTVELHKLNSLESELPTIGRHVSNLSSKIAGDTIEDLNKILLQLLSQIFSSLDPDAHRAMEVVRDGPLPANFLSENETNGGDAVMTVHDDTSEANNTSFFREVAREYLIPAWNAVQRQREKEEAAQTPSACYDTAAAWIHFSIGALKLYLPDRVTDPHLRPKVEMEFFESMKQHLSENLASLSAFEKIFNGQDVSFRISMFQSNLRKLVPPSEGLVPIYRPEASEMASLYATFSSILQNVLGTDLSALLKCIETESELEDAQGSEVLRVNLQRLMDRLSSGFSAYQDIVIPVKNILNCLLVGLSLFDLRKSYQLSATSDELVRATPFFGSPAAELLPVESCTKGFEYLALMTVIVSVQGMKSLSNQRQALYGCFQSFFEDWKQKLEADQESERAKASLFRFRGSTEDDVIDEMELNELFPTYEENDDSPRQTQSKEKVRDVSLRVAEAHKRIFFDQGEPAVVIRDACMAVGKRVSREAQGQPSLDSKINHKLLPTSILLLHEKIQNFQSFSEKSHNFYKDAHLSENRELVILINKVRARFRQFQSNDEIGHMQLLVDVLQSCDGLLELPNADPLAKILPRLEQLHAHVYEWQFGGWVSKIYAVADLYDSLTNTVIKWRRLELSTWASLFDMERKRCEDDGYSWWFIAYQVVIAAPLSMLDSPNDLAIYAKSLFQSLETYISSSMLGQFSTRIALLMQLLNHLNLLVKDYSSLGVIFDTVKNFISHFVLYQPAVDECIKQGLAPIEKKMKEVVLLASWKDTNINALRESARKSHLKLFRLVRKFRGILGQDSKVVIDKGIPESSSPANIAQELPTPASEILARASSDHPTQELRPVEAALPGWLDDHRRLVNAEKTVKIMHEMAKDPGLDAIISEPVLNFMVELKSSVSELRKLTPSVLTEDNKKNVKYLKTRKRKLFADALRNLRAMGIRHNLAQVELDGQGSLADLLTSVSPIDNASSQALQTADPVFHQILDLAKRVRETAREHSEDLTGAEVERSIGFVEGLISFVVSQRNKMAKAMRQFSSLSSVASKLTGLGRQQKTGRILRRKQESDCSGFLSWLNHMIQFALRLIQAHEALSQQNFQHVLCELQAWQARIEAHITHQGLEMLPGWLLSESEVELMTKLESDLTSFRTILSSFSTQFPNLAVVLDQLSFWTEMRCSPVKLEAPTEEVLAFADALATLTDGLLVAVGGAKSQANSLRSLNDESASWLKVQNDSLFSIISRLHIQNVEQIMTTCIEVLNRVNIDEPRTSDSVGSLVSLVVPFIDEFMSICNRQIERVRDFHSASVQLTLTMTKIFLQLAAQGFCTPQEKSDETSTDAGALEAGTGLGDCEGVEDISKDIAPDEDLSELAQEANEEKSGEIENEKDAVDMADEEMAGETESIGEAEDDGKGSQKGDEEDPEDLDEEAGSVDDLDPSAVDEKMWDAGGDTADKEQQGDKEVGEKQGDEQMTLEGEDEKQPEPNKQDPNAEDSSKEEHYSKEDEQDEDVTAKEELNRQDQTAEENQALELPDDMELDLTDHPSASIESDSDDLMSDFEEKAEPAEPDKESIGDENDDHEQKTGKGQDDQDDEEDPGEAEVEMEQPHEETLEDAQGEGEEELSGQEKDMDETRESPKNGAEHAAEDAAPSEVRGSGADQAADGMDMDDTYQAQAAQQENGDLGEGAADREDDAGNEGTMQVEGREDSQKHADQDANHGKDEDNRSNPFRKLGDALEKWHRQRAEIRAAQNEDAEPTTKERSDAEKQKREFQHIQHDDAAADEQAMGAAMDAEAQPVDESMAIDGDEKQPSSNHVMEQDEVEADEEQENKTKNEMAQERGQEGGANEPEQERSGVVMRQGGENRESSPSEQEKASAEDDAVENATEEMSTQLSTTQLSEGEHDFLANYSECVRQWSELQAQSQALSLSLTSQLRLILTPSQSTKLSGSFRTGKRLNIKRIIPYIASSYKRDKIWMRRAIPTKRSYQIMLCVDDSESMGESRSGSLAMESLVMVSRSLSMLEAGQIGIMGFGSSVFTAHELADPFNADAGAKILQQFSFSQNRTDIAKLIRQLIDNFRAARQQQAGSNSDLWQLALLLSDGLTPSSAHDSIRRLLREAMEERIMMVFIIMDDSGKKKGDSVLELKEAKFVRSRDGESSRVVIERYLDTFPFQYYLIVHHLEELPSALVGLLRTWFAEVAS